MSEAWNQIQYPVLTEPVPVNPSDQVNPVWFPQWMQPIDQPVLPVEYRYLLESFFSIGEPIAPAPPPPDYGWFREASQPVRPVEFRYQLEAYFNPPWAEPIDTADDDGVFFAGWVQPVSQPVLPIEYRHTIPNYFVQIEPDDFVTGATPPLAQPVSAVVSSAVGDNLIVISRSGNSIEAVKSQNSVTTE